MDRDYQHHHRQLQGRDFSHSVRPISRFSMILRRVKCHLTFLPVPVLQRIMWNSAYVYPEDMFELSVSLVLSNLESNC